MFKFVFTIYHLKKVVLASEAFFYVEKSAIATNQDRADLKESKESRISTALHQQVVKALYPFVVFLVTVSNV